MAWFDKLFGNDKKNTASNAKQRLMVVVAHQREGRDGGAPYLNTLREEILAVVRKYVQVADSAVEVNLQRKDGIDVLEMDITLPEDVNPSPPKA